MNYDWLDKEPFNLGGDSMETFDMVLSTVKVFDLHSIRRLYYSLERIISNKKREILCTKKNNLCPHCNCSILIKYGFTNAKTQRYKCDSCKKTFILESNRLLGKSYFLKDCFDKMLEYTFDGLSVREIGEKLGVTYPTIWKWITKILMICDSLIDKKSLLGDEIWSDETFLRINLKGTKPHKMPRSSPYCYTFYK
jgi:transposase-like protein